AIKNFDFHISRQRFPTGNSGRRHSRFGILCCKGFDHCHMIPFFIDIHLYSVPLFYPSKTRQSTRIRKIYCVLILLSGSSDFQRQQPQSRSAPPIAPSPALDHPPCPCDSGSMAEVFNPCYPSPSRDGIGSFTSGGVSWPWCVHALPLPMH